MKTSAEIVIIGGGAIGCSIAYHLALLGKTDVLLLEKSGLTHGCTWHAAGLIGQLRNQRNLTRMLQYSTALYDRLEQDTGQATGWRKVGSLRLASSPERWQEIRRTATTARSFGFDLHLITASEARDRFPLMTTDGVAGAAWIPSDGYVDPASLTQAYASGARRRGATFAEGVRALDFEMQRGRIMAVVTDHGTVRTGTVVNAAGLWARDVARLAGVELPAGVVEHQYMVTEKSDAIPDGLPTFRDPDKLFYLKAEPGALAVGGWEPDTVAFGVDGMPWEFGRELLGSNFDRFEQLATPAARRLPILDELGVRTLINGPIPVSPDGEPIMGPVPGVENFFVACAFTAGIAASGGAGRAMARWVVEGDPGMDLWSFDVRRFGSHHNSRRYLAERCVAAYGQYYALHFPHSESSAGRGGRRSALHRTLSDQRAVFGSKFGWERPNWFAPTGVVPADAPSFDTPNWLDAVAQEHRAVRERVGLIDQSSFAKLEVAGPGALSSLQRIVTNDLARPPGSIVYTQVCNERGGIEADLTVTRLDEDRFYVVTGSGFGVHDAALIEARLPVDGTVALRDVTSGFAVINVAGPRSRELLAAVAEQDVSGSVFPYMQARWLRIGYARALALRVTYVGELGYELHIPTEYAVHVYELLKEAGGPLGVSDVGYRAIDSLRLEKRYLYWSSDITPDDNPYEAGLDFCVALDKGAFAGRDALSKISRRGVARRMCCFTLDERRPVFGGEAILQNGEAVGVTTSGNFGHTVGASIVLGYVPVERLGAGGFEVEAFCERIPATRHDKPLYDATRTRILS